MFACGAEREEENVGLHGLFHTLAALIIQAWTQTNSLGAGLAL